MHDERTVAEGIGMTRLFVPSEIEKTPKSSTLRPLRRQRSQYLLPRSLFRALQGLHEPPKILPETTRINFAPFLF